MQFLNKPKTVGAGLHRCGWPYVREHLAKLDTGEGIVCDDFLEQTFTFSRHSEIPQILQENPWITVAHVPPKVAPPFTSIGFQDFAKHGLPGSGAALKNLQSICVMSSHLADRFKQVCDTNMCVIRYATNLDVSQFSMDRYLRKPTLLHVGWFCKNLLLLEHIAPTPHITQRLQIRAACLPNARADSVRSHLIEHTYPHRKRHGNVTYVIKDRLPDADYDTLLTQSVVAIEFIDCAATTVVVEGIARCAPMLLNRHPALLEYVGVDYPMFFDDVRECEQLLHPVNVYKTHEYLKNLDKSFLLVSNFIAQFQEWVSHHEH